MIPCRIDLGGTFSTLMEYGNPALLDYTRDENKNKLIKGENGLRKTETKTNSLHLF